VVELVDWLLWFEEAKLNVLVMVVRVLQPRGSGRLEPYSLVQVRLTRALGLRSRSLLLVGVGRALDGFNIFRS